MSEGRPLKTAEEIAAAVGDHRPTVEQRSVIEAPLAPSLVVAGAGSGKTTTMAARVVYLVANSLVRPDEVLGLTFTRKAAGELAERIRRQLEAARAPCGLGDIDLAVQVSTYDSFAGSLVHDHALRIGADPDAALISRSGAWQIMNEIVQGWTEDLDTDLRPSTVVNRALDLADELRSHLIPVADARAGIDRIAQYIEASREGRKVKDPFETRPRALRSRLALLDLVEAFEQRKRELSVVGYADQVACACVLAAQVPSVGAALRQRYRVVLLDEFQDTSVAQLGLLANLFGAGHCVTAVGDPNQAIYGWRGASADSLDGFRAAFGAPEKPVGVYSLATSWRNDRAILRAANAISAPLRENTLVEVAPLAERPGAGEGTVHAQIAADEDREAAGIARWMAGNWRPGRTAAVLVRARRQFTPLLAAFREAGIPAEVVGLSGLLRAPEVVDVRSALIVAHDAARGDAMMRLLTNARIGVSDLAVLSAWASELAGDDDETASIVEAVDSLPPENWRRGVLTPAARERVAALGEQLKGIRALLSLPLTDVVVGAERILGLDIEVAARAGVDPTRARANLDAFASHAAAFTAGTLYPSLGGFLDWLDAAEANEQGLDLADTQESTEAVQLLTIHAAKGLEWDAVAVAGLSESKFPGYNGRIGNLDNAKDWGWLSSEGGIPYPMRGDADSLPALDLEISDYKEQKAAIEEFARENFLHKVSEERRLAYVAFTRARRALLLSASWTPAGSLREISRFYSEIRHHAVIPEGLAEVPRPEEVNVAVVDYPPYPGAAPAGPRQERLMAAAEAVAQAGTPTLDEVAALDLGERQRELADLARSLLAIEPARAPRAQLTRQLSASRTLALVSRPGEFARLLRRPLPAAPALVAQLGTSFHEWVENYFSLPAVIFGDDEHELLDDEGAAALTDLQTAFLSSPWAERKPAHVELDLETEVAGLRVRCRVDAVYSDGARVEIVDWKTGRRPRDASVVDERTFQLELYRLAYARTYGVPLESISAYLFYVAEEHVLPAPGMTEPQIHARVARALASGAEPRPGE